MDVNEKVVFWREIVAVTLTVAQFARIMMFMLSDDCWLLLEVRGREQKI